MFRSVCRLCSTSNNLVDIFDRTMLNNIVEIIFVTSGVEISKTDMVSQMVCNTCCQVTIKMYQFRTKSIQNDKDLKARCAQYNIVQSKNSTPTNSKPNVTRSIPKNVHFSVKDVMTKYPDIILPSECLKSHVGAFITLLTDEVDDYCKEHNLTDEQIGRYNTKTIGKKRRSSQWDGMKEPLINIGNNRKKPRLTNEIDNKTKESLNKTEANKPGGTVKIKVHQDSNGLKQQKENKIVILQNDTITSRMIEAIVEEKRKSLNSKKQKRPTSSLGLSNRVGRPKVEGKSKLGLPQNNNTASDSTQPQETKLDHLQNNNADTELDHLQINKEESFLGKTNPQTNNSSDISVRSILKDALSVENKSNGKKADETEITLKSLLQSQNMNLEIRTGTGDKSASIIGPMETWFTSRAFSDGEDEDVIFIPRNDSPIPSHSSASSAEIEKLAFVEGLNLTPKDLNPPLKAHESTNQPDLSLVALAPKSYTLYTCPICDSQHSNLKELKLHCRKNHTKCPFCRKRFRTHVAREEHLMNSCPLVPIKMKSARLSLERIDENEDVRKRYPGAFGLEVQDKTNDTTEVTNGPVVRAGENENENPLFCAEQFCPSTENEENIICISDDESEITKSSETTDEPRKFAIVNNSIVNKLTPLENDSELLKKVLTEYETWRQEQTFETNFADCPIVDGSSNKVKIFKNLRKYLQKYKIPIEVKNGNELAVEYKLRPTKSKDISTSVTSWANMKPIELKQYIPVSPGGVKLANNAGSVKKVQTRHKVMKSPSIVDKSPATLRSVPRSNVQTLNLVLTTSMVSAKTTTTATTSPTLFWNNVKTVAVPSSPGTMCKNYLLVPTTLAKSILPKIQSVTSVAGSVNGEQPSLHTVEQLASITNSLMPPSSVTDVNASSASNGLSEQQNVDVVTNNELTKVIQDVGVVSQSQPTVIVHNSEVRKQPIIRVKNLKDLY